MNLQEIYLSNCTMITAHSLRCLAENCGGLTDVTVDGTKITIEDVDEVSMLRPDIDIEGTLLNIFEANELHQLNMKT
jgi:hypothetical protein